VGLGIQFKPCDHAEKSTLAACHLKNFALCTCNIKINFRLVIDENVQYKKDDTHFHLFLPDHPQYNTHEIQCKYLSEFVVPNFIDCCRPFKKSTNLPKQTI